MLRPLALGATLPSRRPPRSSSRGTDGGMACRDASATPVSDHVTEGEFACESSLNSRTGIRPWP